MLLAAVALFGSIGLSVGVLGSLLECWALFWSVGLSFGV